MAASGGKGKSSPHPSGGEGAAPKPTTAATPSVAVKMAWVALAGNQPGTWLYEGLTIGLPSPSAVLPSSENDNVIIVPRPADLVEGVSQAYPWLAKPVKGRLPELHLFPLMEGNNEEIWGAYQEAHPPRAVYVEPGKFRKSRHHACQRPKPCGTHTDRSGRRVAGLETG